MFTLRDFSSEDSDEVSRLARMAWDHTYRHIYSESYIAELVGRWYAPAALRRALPAIQRGEAEFTLATDVTGRIVGFSQVGRDKSGDFELYRIYLHPEIIGRGVGSLLLQRGETFVARVGGNRYHCYAHRLNELGKSFYARKGFVRVPEHDSGDNWYFRKVLAV
jgi:GNAT superfamily N-acetyltransferase